LMDHGFQGKEGQQMPDMPDEFVQTVTDRYLELFERITGDQLQYRPSENISDRILANLYDFYGW